MCNSCSQDPRDALAEAETALCGLRVLLNQQPLSESVAAHDVAALVALVHDRMRPAVDAIQSYVPRG
ncbi:MAG: hypothetical protein ACK4L4_19105 [Gemmobacter sp.]